MSETPNTVYIHGRLFGAPEFLLLGEEEAFFDGVDYCSLSIQSFHPWFQVLTSSWSDGSHGPLAFCCPEGYISPKDMAAFNEEFRGQYLLLSSESRTHFMTSQTLLQVFEQLYSPALAAQRKKFLALYSASCHVNRCCCPGVVPIERLAHLRHNAEGQNAAFICDAWTGTFAKGKGEHHRRETFYKMHRIVDPIRFAAGWSSHGQLVDSMHGLLGLIRPCFTCTLSVCFKCLLCLTLAERCSEETFASCQCLVSQVCGSQGYFEPRSESKT